MIQIPPRKAVRCACLLAAAIAAALPAAAAAAPVAGVHHVPTTDGGSQRFIVKYRPGMAAAGDIHLGTGVMHSALARTSTASSTGALPTVRPLRRTGSGAQVYATSRRLDATEATRLLAQLRRDPQVEYAQIDGLRHSLTTPAPTALQWDMLDAPGGVYAPSAWAHTAGEGVVVAVLDTGILPHPALAANVVPGYDMISFYGQPDGAGGFEVDVAGDGDGRDPDPTDPGDWMEPEVCGAEGDSSWHGTHVAGTVSGYSTTPPQLAGVAWKAKVQPVRVLGHCGGYDSDIADGILWAAGAQVDGIPDNATPAEVINLSLGGRASCDETPIYKEAITAARSRGATVVVAAGNASMDVSGYTPASCPGVIAVAATDQRERAASYTNFGSGITLAAPGGDLTLLDPVAQGLIWSAADSGTTVAINDGILVGMVGTSMAAPHVAGTVALMQAAAVSETGGALSPDRVETILRESARPFDETPRVGLGAGLLDASRAVLMAMGRPLPTERPLVNGVALQGQRGTAGGSQIYTLQVPTGIATLQLRTLGGTGDVSLYAAPDGAPEVESAAYRSQRAGNAETISIRRPQPGTWYLRVVGEAAYSGVSVLGLAR